MKRGRRKRDKRRSRKDRSLSNTVVFKKLYRINGMAVESVCDLFYIGGKLVWFEAQGSHVVEPSSATQRKAGHDRPR